MDFTNIPFYYHRDAAQFKSDKGGLPAIELPSGTEELLVGTQWFLSYPT